MAYRRNKTLDARDKCTVRLYYDCISRGMKKMDAYAYCAEYYDVSECTVRRLVHIAQNMSRNAQ